MCLSRGVPFIAAVLLAGVLSRPTPAAATAVDEQQCARQEGVGVPGAAFQQSACLADLTTAGLAGTPTPTWPTRQG